MQRLIRILLFVVTVTVLPAGLSAQTRVLPVSPLVDHPVSHPIVTRSSSAWRTGLGTWGEGFSEKVLRLRGFNEIHEIKHGGNNGIDRIAVKRSPTGELRDVRFVEVKTTRSNRPKLGTTQYGGQQMSRRWLAANLRVMRRSANQALRLLALEIGRFRRSVNVPIESMGEVVHINSRTGRLTGYSADGRTMRYTQSIEKLLRNLQSRANSSTTRSWAARSMASYDQIRSTNMRDYLGKTSAQQSQRSILSAAKLNNSTAQLARSGLLRDSSGSAAAVILKRSAGRIAVFVAVAVDAKQLFEVEYAYRRGTISVRQRNVQLASTVGGMGGAFAGASGGMAAGAWVGAFGGPIAWATVPAGGFLGGVIGGIGGYFGGSALASYGANAWYASIDGSIRDKFELSLLNDKRPIK